MKSLILAVVLFFTAFSTKSFAKDVPVTLPTLITFKATFSDATDVQWTVSGSMYRADFWVEGEKKIAFFNINDGALIVTCRYLSVAELPKVLQSSLKAHTANATLKELFVVEENETKDYYATIEQSGQKIIYKSALKKWEVFQTK
ncbi:MAG TPA: hypothetical protein VD794_15445 [Flavisolibacter sp.]|nr:hypothetical protein [Flavisolibacter sp.]